MSWWNMWRWPKAATTTEPTSPTVSAAALSEEPAPEKKKGVLVLTIDGGGLRGILSSVIIQRLEKEAAFMNEVDVFVGTSTGSIIAIALAARFPIEQIIEMYERMAPEVFSHSIFSSIRNGDGFAGAYYAEGQEKMKQHLEHTFGDMTLGQLPSKVLIPTFSLGSVDEDGNVNQWKPLYLSNFGRKPHNDMKIVDCILQSSAAPTYFPSYNHCIDGGMVANNPCMVALSHVITAEMASLSKIYMISIGTGNFKQCLVRKSGGECNWGIAQWGPYLLDIIFDGVSEQATHHCHVMLNDRFRRVNPELKKEIGLDDVSAIGNLIDIGQSVDLSEEIEWVQNSLKKLGVAK